MKAITLNLDGKSQTFFMQDAEYSTPINGYSLRRLLKGKKVFFASFDKEGNYLDGSFSANGINHASNLLTALLSNLK